MKEKIEAKIEEIINMILEKEPEDVSYNEYRILDNKLSSLKWEESQKERNKDMAELMAKTFGSGFGSMPASLPDEVKED